MASDRNTQAPGAILAGTILIGTVGGVLVGESSIGFLAGTIAGLIVLLLYWLRDRTR